MFFSKAFAVAATLTIGAFAALPHTGNYRIVNAQNGHRFDVSRFGTGNPEDRGSRLASQWGRESEGTGPIADVSAPAHREQWWVAQLAREGASGFYGLVSSERNAFVNEQHDGNGLTSETFGTDFNVTELSSGAGFIISIPLTNPLMVVTHHATQGQLTLEERNATNNLQVWKFEILP